MFGPCRPYWILIYLLFPENRPPMRTSFSTNIDWQMAAVSYDVIIWKGWYESGLGMTREVLKCLLLLYESKEWPKKGTRRLTKMAKNTKIVTKWSSMGRNRTATLPKWSEKQDLQESDRVIAPNPLKWGFKNDLMATNFSKIFKKIAEIRGAHGLPKRVCEIVYLVGALCFGLETN